MARYIDSVKFISNELHFGLIMVKDWHQNKKSIQDYYIQNGIQESSIDMRYIFKNQQMNRLMICCHYGSLKKNSNCTRTSRLILKEEVVKLLVVR